MPTEQQRQEMMRRIIAFMLAEGLDAEDVLGVLGGILVGLIRTAPADRRTSYQDALISQIVAQGRLQ